MEIDNTALGFVYQLESIIDKTPDDGRCVLVGYNTTTIRLLEFYAETDHSLHSMVIEGYHRGKRVELISDIGVITDLSARGKDKLTVVIVVDILEEKDNLLQLSSLITGLTGVTPYICLMAYQNGCAVNVRHAEYLKCTQEVDKRDISEYNTDNAYRVLSLGKPVDLEFPVLKYHIHVPNGEKRSCADVMDQLYNVAKTVFHQKYFTIYKIEHKIDKFRHLGDDQVNFTIDFRADTPFKINNDFCKLRFYYNPKDAVLSVCSYAPSILLEDDLEYGMSVFEDTQLEHLWLMVVSRIEDCRIDSEIELGPLNTLIAHMYLSDMKMRTKVMLANYLLSFVMLSRCYSLINKVVDGLSWDYFSSYDFRELGIILGSELEELMSSDLDSYISYETDNFHISYNELAESDDDANVHRMLRSHYEMQCFDYAIHSTAVSEALSLFYTSILYKFGLDDGESTRNMMLDSDIIGETYASLYRKLYYSFVDKDNFSPSELIKEINIWIDTRIDLGIVRAIYLSSRNDVTKNYWRRYFSSGRNEDNYVKLARMSITRFAEAEQMLQTRYFTISEFRENIAIPLQKSIAINFSLQETLEELYRSSKKSIQENMPKEILFLMFLVNLSLVNMEKDVITEDILFSINRNGEVFAALTMEDHRK